MVEAGQESLLDFGKRPHRVRGRGLRISLAERLRAARHVPQAVVKVSSFSHGVRQVSQHLQYISRSGDLPLEKENGEILTTVEEQKKLVAQWAIDFDSRKRSRDTANIVFSMPRGSNPEALRRAVRAVGARAFTDYEWVFGVHEDRDHPHAHMMVKMRGREGEKKLQLRKAELFTLREVFAKAAREQGVPLAASPRAARGIGRKASSRALYHLRSKGITPVVERKAAQEALNEVRQGTRVKPWEAAIAARHRQEMEAYQIDARALREQALRRDGPERERLEKAAKELEQFSTSIPEPLTRRQAWLKKAQSAARDQSKNADASRDSESPSQ